MKIHKHLGKVVFFAVFMGLFLSACAQSTDSGIEQRRRGTGVKTAEDAVQEDTEALEDTDNSTSSSLYILTGIDKNRKIASFQQVKSARQSEYTYDTGTRFLDKYGNTKSIDSFIPGDVAEITVSGDQQKLNSLQLSGDVWVQEDISNYTVDESIHAVTIGQTKYSYDPEMDIFSGNARVSFSSLGKADVLRAVGLDKKLISLAITKGHGYLALANTKLFEGSFICVGDKIFEEVTPNMQMEVPEGTYLVTVANDGYGGSKEVTITREQTTSLNLDELKGEGPKYCKITFDVGVEGAVLKIDGKKKDYSKPVKVKYGIHTIIVEADGYEAITEKLVVNSEEAEIEIALTSASGSDSSKSDSSSDTNSTSNTNNNNNSNNTNHSNYNNNSNNSTITNNNTNSNHNNASNNTGSNTNNSSSDGTGSNSANNNNDSSSTDYLTTLYNLLTSINNTNNSSTSNSSTSNSSTSSNNSNSSANNFDDLSDG